jgi:hypothetical protein
MNAMLSNFKWPEPVTAIHAVMGDSFDRYLNLPPLQFQAEAADCWACCVTMLTGDDYDDVYAAGMAFQYYEDGLTFLELITLLRRLGHNPRYHHPEKLAPQYMGAMTRDRVTHRNAIHLVPSLRKRSQSGSHFVYVERGQVLDPTLLEPYTRYDQLETMAVVWLE